MATKVTPVYRHEAAQVFETGEPQDIILQIDGLIPSHDGTFTLRGVKPLNFDYVKVEDSLIEAGVERSDAMDLIQRFAEDVFQTTLAKIIAQRTKRVG